LFYYFFLKFFFVLYMTIFFYFARKGGVYRLNQVLSHPLLGYYGIYQVSKNIEFRECHYLRLSLLGIKGIACHGYAPEQTLTYSIPV